MVPDRELKSTDLTQMALGGIMAVCGYDPDEEHKYDTPPIAPAMWHSYHIGGEYAVDRDDGGAQFSRP